MRKPIPPAAARYELIRNSTLPIQQKWLLEVLNRYQGANPTCWVLQETLARDCSYDCKRQVQRLLLGLFRQGIITISSPNGPNHCNHYSINVEALLRTQGKKAFSPGDTEGSFEGAEARFPPGDAKDGFEATRKTPGGDTEDATFRATRKTPGTPLNPARKLPKKPEEDGCSYEQEKGGSTHSTPSRPSSAPSLGAPDFGEVPGLIKVPWISELISNVEPQLNNPCVGENPFTFKNRISSEVIAGRLASLILEIYKETGVKVIPQVILDAIGSRQFRGVKELSWGWLTSEGNHNGRSRFMLEIRKRLPNNFDPPDNEPPLGANW